MDYPVLGFRTAPTSPGKGSIILMLEIPITMWIWPMPWGSFGTRPTLHQAATLSGIPGKLEVSGDSVAQMWLEGKLNEIVEYNEFDAFTTHLLWARIAHFSGLLSTDQYTEEQRLVRELLETEISNNRPHLERFVNEWDRLQCIIQSS